MAGPNDNLGKAIKEFLAEAEEVVEQLNQDLVTLNDCIDTGECSPDLVNSIFRAAHSLKGLAGMFGFAEIAEFSHNMENLLDSLRLGKVELSQGLLNVLFEAVELLGAMIRGAGSGESDSARIAETIVKINACLSPPPAAGVESPLQRLGLADSILNALTEYEEHRLLENVTKGKNLFSLHASFSLDTFDQDLSELTEILKKYGEVVSTLPSAGANIATHIDFELLFGTTKTLAELTGIVDNDAIAIIQFTTPQQAPPVAPPNPSVPALTPARPAESLVSAAAPEDSPSAKSMSRTVRVDIGKLDELMNIVGELVLSHSAVAGIANRMRGEGFSTTAIELGKAAKGFERKLTELQKGVMDIRMIPVGQLFEKLSRIVRKVSREVGKKIDLRTYGADTELDKLIVEDISDPLMHIVRNSIDHGIESPEDRLAAGKSERGTLRLAAFQKGNHVVIEVEDDGRGLNIERVKKKALEKGLVSSVDGISDKEAIDFIFLPGFSTTDKVSELSGRGVGMDVVKNNIAAVSGMVDIDSVFGRGMKTTITLPITLAIIKALFISTASRIYAIPVTSVLESIIVENKDILTVEKREVMQLRESTLPLIRLRNFFGIVSDAPQPESFYVVVVGVAEKRLGLVVDDLVGQQDIVIKPLGDIFKGYRGISGAADLGDQRTILVLDVGGIILEAFKGS